jgi:hypothetical protein
MSASEQHNFNREAEGDDDPDFYMMSNVGPKSTGLPFVVWISLRGDSVHNDVRVRISTSAKRSSHKAAVSSEMVTVAIRPNIRLVKGTLKSSDLEIFTRWAELNRDVLERHWDEEIFWSMDAVNLLRPLPVITK